MNIDKNSSTSDILLIWLNRNRRNQIAHRQAAKHYHRRHIFLGVTVIALTTIVGTSVFTTLERQVDIRLQIVVGLISLSAAVFSALQTFLRFGERSDKHRIAAARYGSVRRKIEHIISITYENPKYQNKVLTSMREQMDQLATDSPEIPEFVWKRTHVKIEKLNLKLE
ncbi:MAG: SLATT domain-containing protein [Candidatus Lokiarchaeota archaeon]|nr:SLATT domain-containing protein [Candidatus Lokiarchaeota archaeon]